MQAMQFRDDGLLFPPPQKKESQVIGVIVDKKDETPTSPRELYAYSRKIFTGDGYMKIPTILWDTLNKGDWFVCLRSFSKNDDGNTEEELTLMKKVSRANFEMLTIPRSWFGEGFLRILVPFILCPDFICNKETRNEHGTCKKLYLLNMGLGFVTENCEHYETLLSGRVYNGNFKFHAKDNGSVNFGGRGGIHDMPGHSLERDAMWELDYLEHFDDEDSTKKHKFLDQVPKMKEELKKLRTRAEQFDMPSVTITNKEQLEEHRARVIMCVTVHDLAGRVVSQKWVDRETNESSPDKETLTDKFDLRYGAREDPPFKSALPR